jgi:hypothetical protein
MNLKTTEIVEYPEKLHLNDKFVCKYRLEDVFKEGDIVRIVKIDKGIIGFFVYMVKENFHYIEGLRGELWFNVTGNCLKDYFCSLKEYRKEKLDKINSGIF